MPEFIRSFQAGKMNKDLDERLVPQGQYRDALNLDLANSEGSNVGTLQNVKGNVELRGKAVNPDGWTSNYIDELDNPICIGSVKNDINEKIYWFIASDNISAISELDTTTGFIRPVLVDTNNILKFSKDYLITGINIIDKFLFWTDDQSEPKRINIDKFKAGSCNWVTHTKIPNWLPNEDRYIQVDCTSLSGYDNFTEEDITVIKKSPLKAPTLNMSTSEFGNLVPGTGITPVQTVADEPIAGQTTGFENFTYIPNTTPPADSEFLPLPTYGQYKQNTDPITGDPNFYANSNLPSNWDGRVTFTVDPIATVWEAGDILMLSGTFANEFNEVFEYQVRVLVHSVVNNVIVAEIQAISSDIRKFTDSNGDEVLIQWEVVLEEKDPLFEFIFPRFAYRWKYIDNEYSCFSPFSEVAFLGNEFKYISSDAYNIGMTNNIRKLIIESLELGTEEVDEIEILYKESHNTTVYSVDSIKKKDYLPYNAGAGNVPTTFQIKSEIIGAVIQANQILRPWDNVPRKAKSQEIVANRIIYGNYLQNYSVDPTLNLQVNITAGPHSSNNLEIAEVAENPEDNIYTRLPEPSLKSIRTYQAGIVFKDEYGRETPVFTNKNASVRLEIQNSDNLNKLNITPMSSAPDWATHFKFFVKETSNQYYNLALDRFYPAEDGNVWLSFPSSERNKIDEESYIIPKKQHGNNVAIDNLIKYKILSIENEAPIFVKTFETIAAEAVVEIVSGFAPDFLSLQFTTTNNQNAFQDAIVANNFLQIIAGGETDKYEILSGQVNTTGTNTYLVQLEEPLRFNDTEFLNEYSAGDSVTVRIWTRHIEDKPEFEGRFFAKINRDFAFDTNIVASFGELEERFGIITTFEADGAANGGAIASGNTIDDDFPCSQSTKWGLVGNYWTDAGETSVPSLCGSSRAYEYEWLSPTQIGDFAPADMQATFGNVRHQSARLGIGAVGTQSLNSNYWGSHTGKLFSELIGPGSYIRIRTRDTHPTHPNYATKEYRVARVAKWGHKRGYKKVGGGQLDLEGNMAYNLGILLVEPINDPVVGNGSVNDMKHLKGIELVRPVIDDDNKVLTSSNPAIFETEPKEAVDLDLYYEASNALPIADYNNEHLLSYYNCYSYGQGVESNRIRDDFNAHTIDKGPKVSAPLDEPYAQERRGNGLIFSQIFNSTSGINRLNQFIQAEPITKDLNPTYGTIQKLHTRQTDLLALCEDKIVKILANKDALFNADGNVNLTGNNAVLGQAMVPATFGEFGISKNPESFAADNYRIYFADKNRGAVLRLSMNGVTDIAGKGMSDFFADNLKVSNKLIGSFDKEKDLYNITFDKLSQQWINAFSSDQDYQLSPDCNVDYDTARTTTTVSFKEMVDGWTSRKSFIPESGISLNNIYYTFKKGRIYEHGLNLLANNFYRVQYDSSFNVLMNDAPQVVKGFSTINYTGTQSRRFEYSHNSNWYSIAEINAIPAIPTASQQKRAGWYVNYVKTDLEGGEVKEFEKKEGKWFNYIKGLEIFNDCDFEGDGIGNPDIIDSDPQEYVLTITIDEECSSTGATTPDTTQIFVNIWTESKPDAFPDLNIVPLTTAQNVKCAIEDYYDNYNQNYANLINQGTAFSYVFSDGLQVGTQMYHSQTGTPISTSGAYLFVGAGEQMSDVTVSAAGLDANNSTVVPASYYVMILNSSGQIASWTQYNTLNACQGAPDRSLRGTAGFASSLGLAAYNFSFPAQTNDQLWCGVSAYMLEWSTQDPDERRQGWQVPTVYWYGPGNFQVGTQLYSYNSLDDTYIPKNQSTGGQTGTPRKEVYKLGSYWDGSLMGHGTYWNNNSAIGDEWFIVSTSGDGIITAIEQYNTFNPNCQ